MERYVSFAVFVVWIFVAMMLLGVAIEVYDAIF